MLLPVGNAGRCSRPARSRSVSPDAKTWATLPSDGASRRSGRDGPPGRTPARPGDPRLGAALRGGFLLPPSPGASWWPGSRSDDAPEGVGERSRGDSPDALLGTHMSV